MNDYRDAGQSLIQSGDDPFVNQYGKSVLKPTALTAPAGASDGSTTPGGGGTPTLSLSAYVLSFSSRTNGPNPPSQTIELTNSGTGTISFSVGSVASWLTVSPTSGSAPSTLTLSINNTGLVAGTYTHSFTITATGALGSPATVDVTLVVEADWSIPTVDPINKKAWIGYFKTATFNGEYTTTACTGTANACVVSRGDFGSNPEANNWATRQRNAATQIAALGGKIFIGTAESEILNMKAQWSQVGGISTAVEGFPGSTFAEQVTACEADITACRAIIKREGLENRIFTVYIDSGSIPSLTKWIAGMNWLMLGAYLTYDSASESAISVRNRAAATISTCMATITPLIPTTGKVVLAAQAYDRGPGTGEWDAVTLEYLQKAYPDALRAYPQIHGIFWFCYERSGHGVDGHPTLIPWHKATKQAILGTPDLEVPVGGPYGSLLVCNTSTISGTAADYDYPNQSVIVQVFDGPGVLGSNSNRIGQLSTVASTGAFGYSTPSSLLDGNQHTVYAYAVSRSGPPYYQVNLSGSPKTVQLVGGSSGVTVSGRSFLYQGSPFTWIEASAFMGVKRILNDGATGMDSALTYWQSKGVTVLRVFGMIGNNDEWAGWTFTPATAGYYSAWQTLLTKAAAKGIIIEACLFADTSVLPGYDSYSEKLAFVKEFAATMASYKNFTIELCNEPWHPYNGNGTTVSEWATMATEYLKIDPSRIITFGAPQGDSDTSMNTSPTKYIVIHSDRESGWGWVTGVFDPSNPNVSQSTMPCVDNEPINATSSTSQQIDSDPGRWYAYGLGSQLRQMPSCFHYGGGLFASVPTGTTETLLTYWLIGRNEVPWNWGGTYFHGAYPTSATSPFNSNGQSMTMGRVSGTSARALVIAPNNDWSPSLRPGWTATLGQKVSDNNGTLAAYYYTLTYG